MSSARGLTKALWLVKAAAAQGQTEFGPASDAASRGCISQPSLQHTILRGTRDDQGSRPSTNGVLDLLISREGISNARLALIQPSFGSRLRSHSSAGKLR
jgi:hypothetical protein